MGVGCAVQGGCRGCGAAQGAPLTHPEAAGGCRVREGERIGSTKAVMGQVLGGGEMSSKRSKNTFVFDFIFTSGRLVGDTGWFSVSNRPPIPLNMPSQKLQLGRRATTPQLEVLEACLELEGTWSHGRLRCTALCIAWEMGDGRPGA